MFEKLTECEELVMKVVWGAGEELYGNHAESK